MVHNVFDSDMYLLHPGLVNFPTFTPFSLPTYLRKCKILHKDPILSLSQALSYRETRFDVTGQPEEIHEFADIDRFIFPPNVTNGQVISHCQEVHYTDLISNADIPVVPYDVEKQNLQDGSVSPQWKELIQYAESHPNGKFILLPPPQYK
jgi:hypothetical protein